MKPDIDYTLYFITDETIMTTRTVEESVENAISGGATLIQLREKSLSSGEFYRSALRVKKVTSKYNVPLIINDRADIALAVDAAGVHIGQNDLPVKAARKILGEDKIIGVSARTPESAKAAELAGADYLGVGAVNFTSTKADAKPVTLDCVKEICRCVSIPIVIIGGVDKSTLSRFARSGVSGAAVISAIAGAADISSAAGQLKPLCLKLKK